MERSCDICGRNHIKAVIGVEGAKLVVCGSCARSGKVLYWLDEGDEDKPIEQLRKAPPQFRETEEIVEDYAIRIKKAIDRLRIKRETLAERINEKASLIEKFETGRLRPDFKVARKLEKELGIKLIEKVEEEVSPTVSGGKFSEPTLADMLTKSKKKKGD